MTSAVTSSPGHTPGPWEAEFFGSPRIIATDAKGPFPVCDIRGWGHLTGNGHGALGLSHDEAAAIQDANARLIAAAPDMLDVLTEAAGLQAENYGDATALHLAMTVWVQKARTVLAKARSLPAI